MNLKDFITGIDELDSLVYRLNRERRNSDIPINIKVSLLELREATEKLIRFKEQVKK